MILTSTFSDLHDLALNELALTLSVIKTLLHAIIFFSLILPVVKHLFTRFFESLLNFATNENCTFQLLLVTLLVQLLLGHHAETRAHILSQYVQVEGHILIFEARILFAHLFLR